jgi:hypothetical protein
VVTVGRRTAEDTAVTAPETTEDAVSAEGTEAAARELVQRLHDEAMQLIADLAENWDPTAAAGPAERISVLRISELPAPPPFRPLLPSAARQPSAASQPSAATLAAAVTDQIAVQQAADGWAAVPAAA